MESLLAPIEFDCELLSFSEMEHSCSLYQNNAGIRLFIFS